MTILRRVMLGIVLGTVFLSAAPSAFAGPKVGKAQAKEAFRQGKDFFREGKYQEAAEAFRRAMELAPSWKLYFNIGQCEAAAKRYGRAYEAFQMYIVEGGDAISEQRELKVQGEISKLKNKVGAVKISAPAGAEILIDGVGRAIAPLPGKMYVTVGKKHEIVVQQGNQVLVKEIVQVWSGETTEIEAVESTPGRADEGAASTPEEAIDGASDASSADTKSGPLVITGWVLTGIGGAALVAGGIAGGLAASKAKELESDCPDKVCTDPSDQDQIDSARTGATLSTVMLSAGGAVAVTGLILVIAGNRKARLESIGLRATPVFTADSMGISLSGRF